MALQLGALRGALIDAGATPDKASRAAEEVASHGSRLASLESKVSTLTWMVGTNIAVSLLILGLVLRIPGMVS